MQVFSGAMRSLMWRYLEAIESAKVCHGRARSKSATDPEWYREMRKFHLKEARKLRNAIKAKMLPDHIQKAIRNLQGGPTPQEVREQQLKDIKPR